MRQTMVLLGVVALLLAGPLVMADGVPFRIRVVGAEIEPSQTAQQAALFWNDGIEALHLKSNYIGPREAFAWVIPVPAMPTVSESDWRAFEAAEEATRPRLFFAERVPGSFGCGCGAAVGVREESPRLVPAGVTLLSSLDIKELHVDILSAEEHGGLMRWLEENDYVVPAQAEPILHDYIRKGFYFIAVRYGKEELRTAGEVEGTRDAISTGLTPLRICFPSAEPFFPLKISSIASAPENELLLLVISRETMLPREYAALKLDYREAQRALQERYGSQLKEMLLDGAWFAGAWLEVIRTTQQRSLTPALTLEALLKNDTIQWYLHDAGQAASIGRELGLKDEAEGGGQDVFHVARYHALLSPTQMRDITFQKAPADGPSELFPQGISTRDGVARDASAVYACAALTLLGCAGIAWSFYAVKGTRLRLLSVLLFICAACLL